MPGRPCGADFLNFCHAGLYPDVITRVKFPVDWPRVWSLRPIGLCGCLKLGALVLPMIVALTTVLYALAYRDTLWPAVPSCKWIMLNCFITRGPTTCLCTGALSTLATPLIWNDLVILFLWPVVSMPQTEKTLSTYAWLAGADIMSSATSDSLS